MDKLSRPTKEAIKKYCEESCRRAFYLHNDKGYGANSVGIELGLTTNQADAAINAGRELVAKEKEKP